MAGDLTWEIERSWATEALWMRPEHPAGVVPRAYQQAGVEYALARHNCIFGDEPGLGKTAQCILVSNMMEARRTLVVCPASLRLNWEREIWSWSTLDHVRTHVVLKARDGIAPAHYVVLSYDLLRNRHLLDALLDIEWDHLILDEGHYLKDPRGNARIRPICASDGLAARSGRVSLATGTLMPNQPVECYNAVRLLDWSALDFMSLASFREHYYEGGGWVQRYSSVKHRWESQWSARARSTPRNMQELRMRLRSKLMVRRLKENVLKELPERQWRLVPLEPTSAMRTALRHEGWRVVEQLHRLDEGDFDADVAFEGAVASARRELGEAKAPAMASIVKQMLREGVGKVLVSAWHLSVLELLREALAPFGLVYMDGSTSAIDKQAAVDAFQQGEDIQIMLGQMLPLSKGWTLTAAQHAVLCEPHWTPGENVQFLDRIHRIGQVGSCVVGHVPVVPDSLDERIMSAVVRKGQVVQLALDG